jgi:hypothetical protein
VKIYALLTALIIAAAIAQTTAPKPKPAQPPAAPQLPAKGPFADIDPDRVVATIGTEKLTARQFDAIVDSLPPQVQAQINGPGKRQFVEGLVKVKIMAKQAVTMNLDKDPMVQTQLQYARESVLYNMAAKAYMQNAEVDNEGVQKYYDAHKDDYQQATVHHILIRFKGSPVPLKPGQPDLSEEGALAKAEGLVKRLKAGEDFAEIAKAESDDPGSAAKGGEYGPFRHGQTVGPFESVAFSAPEGQVNDPVKSQFGYHVIRVDKRDMKTFEQARPEIVARLRPELAQKQMDEVKSKVNVKLDEKFFGPPLPAPGTTMK